MASTSLLSNQKRFKYEVFLSFRGEDTRHNFVDRLYRALTQQHIDTYKDDVDIEKGQRISEQLIRSIEDSKLYIIVFSKQYASSSWCLDELAKIMECQELDEHTAYPVFYHVEPTEVRKQIGPVEEAFAIHKEKVSAEKWRKALREAANLAGWELKATHDGHETKFIEEIVKEILVKLRFSGWSVDPKLVGMEKRVDVVVSSLEVNIDDVRMIGIKGIGGGGKTTLAKAVFDQIAYLYEGSSFVANVRESTQVSGLKLLQKQVLSDVLNDSDINVNGFSDLRILMKKKMCNRKVLLVLDDVDHTDQLDALAGETNWFKPGSRVIITTRDEQVLLAHGVPKNLILNVNLLSHDEAIRLFSRRAFGRDIPDHGFEMSSYQVLSYANGLPLTIKVLGSFLHGKDEKEWTDALERLKEIPLKDTLDVLELSYNSLEEDYKEIFLNVACILKGWKKEEAVVALECCGFYATNGLKVLEQKSLITASDGECLSMHDHIEEMGKNIVRRLHPNEPYKHSRMWIGKEVEDILVNDMGTELTRYICVRMVSPDIFKRGLRKMKELRFLQVECERHCGDFRYSAAYDPFNGYCEVVDAIGGDDNLYLPNSLQYLRWERYPFTCLPKSFQANNLVSLIMRFSNIDQLWEGGENKVLKKLKFIDLSVCDLRTLDIGLFPNLESLRVEVCDNLELRMPVRNFKLKVLSLIRCLSITTLDLKWAQNLETLTLNGCYFAELHMPVKSIMLKNLYLNPSGLKTHNLTWAKNLQYLHLEGCKLETLNLMGAQNLEKVTVVRCKNLVEFHMPIESMHRQYLHLEHCRLKTLNLTGVQNLEKLSVIQCEDLLELHTPIESLHLQNLHLKGCKLKTLNLMRAQNLKKLTIVDCKDLVELHLPVEVLLLEYLYLENCKLKFLYLTRVPNLMKLVVHKCEELEELHMPVKSFKLETLDITYSKLRTLDLSEAHELETLTVDACGKLEVLHMPFKDFKLEVLQIYGTKLKTLDLGQAHNLFSLTLLGCIDLVELHMPVKCVMLKRLSLNCYRLKTLNLAGALNLKTLDLQIREELEELHMPVKNLMLESAIICNSKLRTLDLVGAQNLKMLRFENCEELEELNMPVECLMLEDLFLQCSMLKTLNLTSALYLKRLNLEECDDLEEVHMPVKNFELRSLEINCSKVKTLDLARAQDINKLDLFGCDELEYLNMPVQIHMLKSIDICHSRVRTLDLAGAQNLETLTVIECDGMVELHMPVKSFKLKHLFIYNSKLKTLDLVGAQDLGTLHVERCKDLVELRMPLQSLKLKDIYLKHSKLKTLDLKWALNLKKLNLIGCKDLRTLYLGESSNLKRIDLKKCYNMVEIHAPIGCLNDHVHVSSSGCARFNPFLVDQGSPMVLAELHLTMRSSGTECQLHTDNNLHKLSFECVYKEPRSSLIGDLEKRISVHLYTCTNLASFLGNSCGLQSLRKLTIEGSIPKVPIELEQLEFLEELSLLSTKIEHLPDSIFMLKCLKVLRLESWKFLKKLPNDLGRLECLEELHLTDCTSLGEIPNSICEMKRLKCFHLSYCTSVKKLPKEIGRLKCLEELNIECTGISHLPRSIRQLEGLLIIGSRPHLKSYGVASVMGNSKNIRSSITYRRG